MHRRSLSLLHFAGGGLETVGGEQKSGRATARGHRPWRAGHDAAARGAAAVRRHGDAWAVSAATHAKEREREEKLGFRLAGGSGRVFVPPISAPGCLIETLAIGRPVAAGPKSAHVGSARQAAFPAQAQAAAKGGGRGRPRARKAAVGRPAKAERVYFRSLGAEAKEKKSIFCPCFRSICNYSY